MNLLPWRQINRKKALEQFITRLIIMLILTIALMIYINYRLSHDNANQRRLRDAIAESIKQVEAKMSNTKELQRIHQTLLRRKEKAACMQLHLQQFTEFFEGILPSLPAGIYFKKMKINAREILIEGFTEKTTYLSIFMKSLQKNNLVKDISSESLISTTNSQEDSQKFYGFKLRLLIQMGCYRKVLG